MQELTSVGWRALTAKRSAMYAPKQLDIGNTIVSGQGEAVKRSRTSISSIIMNER